MIGFLIFFVGVVLFSGVLFYELARSNQRALAKGYGPKSQVQGEPCSKSILKCVSYKAPTLGRSISQEYELRLYADQNKVTGTFEHIKDPASFSGSLFLTLSRGRVKGRSLMGGLQVCEGTLHEGGASLTRGFPKGGILGLFSGTYEYSVRGGRVFFDKTTSPGSISKDSELFIEADSITGRVFHGPQKTWVVDVDVPFAGIDKEVAALAVILACDHILRNAHDGVNSIDEFTD